MMNCARCVFHNDGLESIIDKDGSENRICQSDEEWSDIGGFAKIAGILNELKSSERQVSHQLATRYAIVYSSF